jgi:hypothetical protein
MDPQQQDMPHGPPAPHPLNPNTYLDNHTEPEKVTKPINYG